MEIRKFRVDNEQIVIWANTTHHTFVSKKLFLTIANATKLQVPRWYLFYGIDNITQSNVPFVIVVYTITCKIFIEYTGWSSVNIILVCSQIAHQKFSQWDWINRLRRRKRSSMLKIRILENNHKMRAIYPVRSTHLTSVFVVTEKVQLIVFLNSNSW